MTVVLILIRVYVCDCMLVCVWHVSVIAAEPVRCSSHLCHVYSLVVVEFEAFGEDKSSASVFQRKMVL